MSILPWQVRDQMDFLGYRDTLKAHPEATLWLCASQRDPVEKRVRTAVEDAASHIFPITLATYNEVIQSLTNALWVWDKRGVGRLSLPETLYAERPEEGTAKVGSHQRNGGIIPPTGRLLWADIDTDTGHASPPDSPYPYPTPEEGRCIAERLARAFEDAAVLVESGSGGFQVYIRATDAVTDADFAGYLTALEEQYERYIDKTVIGRHGPVRVWGHQRPGKGTVQRDDRHSGSSRIVKTLPDPVSGSWDAADGWYERYVTRIGAATAARAEATTTARGRVNIDAQGDSPRTRMNLAVPASAYVEYVHDGEVRGDEIRLRRDFDISIRRHEDCTEYISTFSPTTMATLRLEPGDSGAASATTYGLLAAVVGKHGAWRIACAFDGRYDRLLPWVAEHFSDLNAATSALPAPKGNPAAAKKKRADRNLAAAFNAKYSALDLTGKPSRRSAAEIIRRKYGDEAEQVMCDLLGL